MTGATAVNPTPMQVFFAREWPAKIWLSIGPAICLIKASRLAEISTWTLAGWASEFVMAVCMLVAIPIGLFFSAVTAFIVLQPLCRMRLRMNGGPFQLMDNVRVLVGPHKGRVGQVTNYIQHSGLQELPELEVAVQFADGEGDVFSSVFSQVQLVRAEPQCA